jgi:ABC-2 type transport system ATP-binding protein
MMDQFGVYERLSCIDNLKVFADIYGVPTGKIKRTLEKVGLGDAGNKAASTLSKGMRARLALARVFMHSPKLIFLDEPTSGLDPQTMRQIHKIILEKKKEGCTIFLTTHNMEEAYKLCDRVALLNEGVIVENGAPEEISAENIIIRKQYNCIYHPVKTL